MITSAITEGYARIDSTIMRACLGRMGKRAHHLPGLGEIALLVQRVEQSAGFRRPRGCPPAPGGEEVEGLEVLDAELRHAQNDLGEVGAEDLLHRVHGPAFEVLLRVQAIADAGRRPPRPAPALVARGLGDGHSMSDSVNVLGL